jgi:hypothetical protein
MWVFRTRVTLLLTNTADKITVMICKCPVTPSERHLERNWMMYNFWHDEVTFHIQALVTPFQRHTEEPQH